MVASASALSRVGGLLLLCARVDVSFAAPAVAPTTDAALVATASSLAANDNSVAGLARGPEASPLCETDASGRGAVPRGATSCAGGLPSHVTGWLDPLSEFNEEVVPSAPAQNFAGSCARWDSPKRIAFIHVGKTGGETIKETLYLANLNFTAMHVVNAAQALEDYDLYIVSTREPVSRVASAFNFIHADGGGLWDPGISKAILGLTPRTLSDSTHLSEQPLSTPIVPTANGAVLVDSLSRCFPQLPGGFDAFATALDGSDHESCSDVARRCLLEPNAGCGHVGRGYAFYLAQTSSDAGFETLADKMRKPTSHVFHVSQENLDSDLAALWEWLCVDAPPATVDVHEDLLLNRSQLRHDDTQLSAAGSAALTAYLSGEYEWLRTVSAITENKLSDPVDGAPMSATTVRTLGSRLDDLPISGIEVPRAPTGTFIKIGRTYLSSNPAASADVFVRRFGARVLAHAGEARRPLGFLTSSDPVCPIVSIELPEIYESQRIQFVDSSCSPAAGAADDDQVGFPAVASDGAAAFASQVEAEVGVSEAFTPWVDNHDGYRPYTAANLTRMDTDAGGSMCWGGGAIDLPPDCGEGSELLIRGYIEGTVSTWEFPLPSFTCEERQSLVHDGGCNLAQEPAKGCRFGDLNTYYNLAGYIAHDGWFKATHATLDAEAASGFVAELLGGTPIREPYPRGQAWIDMGCTHDSKWVWWNLTMPDGRGKSPFMMHFVASDDTTSPRKGRIDPNEYTRRVLANRVFPERPDSSMHNSLVLQVDNLDTYRAKLDDLQTKFGVSYLERTIPSNHNHPHTCAMWVSIPGTTYTLQLVSGRGCDNKSAQDLFSK